MGSVFVCNFRYEECVWKKEVIRQPRGFLKDARKYTKHILIYLLLSLLNSTLKVDKVNVFQSIALFITHMCTQQYYLCL